MSDPLKNITIRATPAQIKDWHTASEYTGVTFSEWARALLDLGAIKARRAIEKGATQ